MQYYVIKFATYLWQVVGFHRILRNIVESGVKRHKPQACHRQLLHVRFVGFIVLNATFNNISAISWWSVLLVKETGGPAENHRPS